jgi:hypothetical protein
MKRSLPFFLLFAAVTITAYSYEIPHEDEVTSRVCRMQLQTKVIPDEQQKQPAGRAIVTVLLVDDEGNSYPKERVSLTATAGTFVCVLPEERTDDGGEPPEDCFITGYDGKATVYLINIPINTQVRVTARYECDERAITSTASLSISRSVVKKKKQVKP